MSRIKGTAKSGGRKQGTPNKTTKEARELFVQIMNDEIPNIKEALQQIKAESPVKYVDALAKLFQYTIPKQLDVTSDGERITDVKVTYVNNIGDTGK
jgi:Na+-transporting NADH:ubiquinone oxidoreductase subunit NqrD